MDGSAAIERNRVALRRIVLSLFAMLAEAGIPGAGPAASGSSRPLDAFRHATGMTDFGLRPIPASLPRHLWCAVLRLLRPAESAARRLIIAAARGIAVTVPSANGTSAVLPRKANGTKHAASAPRTLTFPLLDPLRDPLRQRRCMTPPYAAPRIMLPGVIEPFRPPPPPAPDDAVSAARLGQRLAALAAVLDDLPGHARRFARWKAHLNAGSGNAGRVRRNSPLRAGRPPGGRLSGWDASARDAAAARARALGGRPVREIDLILAHAHELAFDALTCPDTS
ncbi:hypothetical protein [Mesorhizobium sp. Z1-4]|uniref:hypothetical protein n=1 Tax=Mesorhizobium sp. Z1-4 TaxID=2448478 RepID=UPI000FD7ECAA|nr:hypothetical protein [Mesorhizobium sp. Z1-4]